MINDERSTLTVTCWDGSVCLSGRTSEVSCPTGSAVHTAPSGGPQHERPVLRHIYVHILLTEVKLQQLAWSRVGGASWMRLLGFVSSGWRFPENLQPASDPRIPEGSWAPQQSSSGVPPARRDGLRSRPPRSPGEQPRCAGAEEVWREQTLTSIGPRACWSPQS